MSQYFGWDGLQEILEKFAPAEGTPLVSTTDVPVPRPEEVLFASLSDDGSYEEYAFILFEHDGKLWSVEASHCSCSGFEDRWEPGETSWGALRLAINEREKARVLDGERAYGLFLGSHSIEAYEYITKLVAERMTPTSKIV